MMRYVIYGTVIRGDGYGRLIGYPTANIDRRQWSRLSKEPKFGVYAGFVVCRHCEESRVHPVKGRCPRGTLRPRDDEAISISDVNRLPRQSHAFPPRSDSKECQMYPAGIIIGPLDKKGLPKLEAHLIGFSGNLYSKKISLHLTQYLHPFIQYASERKLIDGIRKDILRVKKIIKLGKAHEKNHII